MTLGLSLPSLPRNLRPTLLSRRPRPFDSDDFIFEIKFDGFRSLAFIEHGVCTLVSRNRNPLRFPNLANAIADNLTVAGSRTVENAVIDGEIVCLDNQGRSVFDDLLFRRAEPFFYAFDLLWLNGED